MKHNVAKCLDNRQPDVNKYLSAFSTKSEKSSLWFAANLSTEHATHMLSKTSAAEFVTTFLSGGIKSRGQTGHRLTTELFNCYQSSEKGQLKKRRTQTLCVTLRKCLR